MRTKYALHRGPRQKALLDQLIRQRLTAAGYSTGQEYALFFVTGEGHALPSTTPGEDIEETSGYVMAPDGHVFFFWLGWDALHQAPALTQWAEEAPAPSWIEEPEYRRARERLGLFRAHHSG
jgi:hypothetical protein